MVRKEAGEDPASQGEMLIEKLLSLYQREIAATPHRIVELTGRRCRNPRIISTLLGYELQIRDRRFNCPDLATASYLKVFAMIGSPRVMVPLDPTRTADLLPALESLWSRIRSLLGDLEASEQRQSARRIHAILKDKIRIETGTDSPIRHET